MNIFNLLPNDLLDKIFDEVDTYDKEQYENIQFKKHYNSLMNEFCSNRNFIMKVWTNVDMFIVRKSLFGSKEYEKEEIEEALEDLKIEYKHVLKQIEV